MKSKKYASYAVLHSRSSSEEEARTHLLPWVEEPVPGDRGWAAAAPGEAEAGEREEQGQKASGEDWEQGQGCSLRRRRRAGRARAVTPAVGWGCPPARASNLDAGLHPGPALNDGSWQPSGWASRPPPRAGGPGLLCLLPWLAASW